VPWLHQETTTLSLYGAYEGGEVEREGTPEPTSAVAPRPAYGHSKDRRPDLKQVVLSLGVSGDGGLPLRMGVRDGNTSDSTETPVALKTDRKNKAPILPPRRRRVAPAPRSATAGRAS
jgi:transposase